METEKLYSPLNFYLRDNDMLEKYDNSNYWRDDMPHYEASEYMDNIELFLRRDRDKLDKTRGMMEYYDSGTVNDKVVSLFPTIEEHDGNLWCVAELTLNELLTPDEMSELKDWWTGQLSDGWGESLEQREIKIDRGGLYIEPWTSDGEFFIDTQKEFAERFGLDYLMPVEVATVGNTEEQAYTEVKLYSPVFCDFWEKSDVYHDYPKGIDQRDAAQYFDEIHTAILRERLSNEAERGLMTYYDEAGSVGEKVRSLFVDVEVYDDELWAVATLELTEALTPDELDSLRDFIEGQYYDGFGEGFEQRPVNVAGGELNVHLWKNGDAFFIDTEQEFEKRMWPDVSTTEEHAAGETLSPAQMALDEPGIFDEGIDCVETSTYMSMLTDRLNANYTDYIDRLRGMDDGGITNYTSEIARVSEAHYYLTERFNFHFSELDYLLKFKDPLMVVAEAFSADIDNEHSDVMWKIFHEQDALKSGRHELAFDASAQPATPSAEALKQGLFNRLDKNIADYYKDMMKNSKADIIDFSEDIFARLAARDYMKTAYDYKTGEVEFLLQFQNPLALVADNWLNTTDGVVDMTPVMPNIFENKSSHRQYALVMDVDNPATKEKGHNPESTKKQSVIKRIRAAEKEPKQPRKDKSSRDKSESEH